ncbi:MarR family winged helix-turn-helix transcriptional regulator [Microbacterium sp. B2969]|uniref:MarR family winged helix-turn-helix transcriptional regulator n=1 Tax=Microbacterium alkaliflavum TaxID=3248839 RepID=A0ABW7Q8F0_9MICO
MSTPAAPDDVVARAVQAGLQTERLPRTIDRDTYTPALIGLLNNLLVWGGSRVFHQLHDVGTNEWRVISALGNFPGSTASDLCDVLGMNKSIASKSVNTLLARQLIAQLDGRRGSRHLYLTDEGARMHDDLLPLALERERILHTDLTAAEIEQLNALLVRMLGSAPALQAFEVQVADGSTGDPAA